jgi:hypothetical protein
MKTALAILLTVLLAQQTVIFAQTRSDPPADTWSEVKALQTGDVLTVKLRDGKSLKGKLVFVRDDGLALKDGKHDTVLSRESIFQVYRYVPKSRKKAMAVGATVGGGLGILGAASTDGAGDLPQPAATVMSGAVYAGVGALIGWALGGGKKRVLIYQAQQ